MVSQMYLSRLTNFGRYTQYYNEFINNEICKSYRMLPNAMCSIMKLQTKNLETSLKVNEAKVFGFLTLIDGKETF